jgi:hypothetical protein
MTDPRITPDKSNDSKVKVSTPDVLKDKPATDGESSTTDRKIDNIKDNNVPLRR